MITRALMLGVIEVNLVESHRRVFAYFGVDSTFLALVLTP
jgi:hypothetical protein